MTSATYDLEAEQAVLGAFLIAEETWARIGETFSPDAFYLQAHHAIAAAIIAAAGEGDPADPILLRGDLIDADDRTAADLVFPLAKGIGTAAEVVEAFGQRSGAVRPLETTKPTAAKTIAILRGGRGSS